jgi:hypothetical protein
MILRLTANLTVLPLYRPGRYFDGMGDAGALRDHYAVTTTTTTVSKEHAKWVFRLAAPSVICVA